MIKPWNLMTQITYVSGVVCVESPIQVFQSHSHLNILFTSTLPLAPPYIWLCAFLSMVLLTLPQGCKQTIHCLFVITQSYYMYTLRIFRNHDMVSLLLGGYEVNLESHYKLFVLPFLFIFMCHCPSPRVVFVIFPLCVIFFIIMI